MYLFIFKKELKNVLKSRKTKNYRRFIWTICPRPKTTEWRHASRHNNASNCVMVCIPKQIHPSKNLGNNSYFFLMIFFSSTDFVITASANGHVKFLKKGDGVSNSSNTFALIWVRSVYLFLLLWLLKNSSNGQNRFFILKFESKRDL